MVFLESPISSFLSTSPVLSTCHTLGKRLSESLSGVGGPVGGPMRWEDPTQNVSGTMESW